MIKAEILPGFWHERLEVNAREAIFHQWEQLESSGCIENFRIAAGDNQGFREGWFFADSDAFKWLDAAARVYKTHPSPRLERIMDDFIALIARTQEDDGYIYTYNQIHFPRVRWANLQIEHELYCHGHLIEAGVSHYRSTGDMKLLGIAQKAADRIAADFQGKGPKYTPGHQEIEIALLRLHQVTDRAEYLELARQFIQQRGGDRKFAFRIFQQNASVARREKEVKARRQDHIDSHPGFKPFQVPSGNQSKKPWDVTIRWMIDALNGKYFQQHKPISQQTVPVGHAVRFAYMETAAAMLVRAGGDDALLPALEAVWERMVSRRMYVTGGIGSLPVSEGFGRDYELDPEVAYAETCAALGSMFWSWEMAAITRLAQYSDLFEWQLYNAAGVGMGVDGKTYFYNNPLTCQGGVTRQAWYEIPCCPSNITRTLADLGSYLFSREGDQIWVHQYLNSEGSLDELNSLRLTVDSGLPWRGNVKIELDAGQEQELTLNLRVPSWAAGCRVWINGERQEAREGESTAERSASGYDPRKSYFWPLRRNWSPGDLIEIEFDLEITLRRADPKVKGHEGKGAVTRGPLVYCLENLDNPGLDVLRCKADPGTLAIQDGHPRFEGIKAITAQTDDSDQLTFIPYYLWGNRGESQMTVWVNTF